MTNTLPARFVPSCLVTAGDGQHWAAAGALGKDEAVVVDGVAGSRFSEVGVPVFTSAGVLYSCTDKDGGVGVVAPTGTCGPYEDGELNHLTVNGEQFAYVIGSRVKGKPVITVYINGVDAGVFREMGVPLPHPDGGFCSQADLTGRKEAKGLEHKQAILRNGDVVASGPDLQYAAIARTGLYYLEHAGKAFRLCKDGQLLASHEWMMPPAVDAQTGAAAWAGRDKGRWKLYAGGVGFGDFDDVSNVQVAADGSCAASVQKKEEWFAVTASAEHGPFDHLSTVSAGPGQRIAFVATDDEGLIVGIDGESSAVASAGNVAFCADGALAYRVARTADVWTLVHAGGEVGPFGLLSDPVRVGDHFVAHGLRDGAIVRIEVPASPPARRG